MADKNTKYFHSDVRITFTGKTAVDANGNKPTVEIINKSIEAFILAIETTYPDLKIVPSTTTDYSDKPIKVKVTTKKL